MTTFIEEFGHRKKDDAVHLRGLGDDCELAVLGGCRLSSRGVLYMDHCHYHGFVRGWVCHEHNRTLTWYEHGRYLVYGFKDRPSEELSVIFRYLRNCRGCDALGLQQLLDLRKEALRCAPVSRRQAETLITQVLRSTRSTSRALPGLGRVVGATG